MCWKFLATNTPDILLLVVLIRVSGNHQATCPKLELQTQEQGRSRRTQECAPNKSVSGKKGDRGEWSGQMGMGWDRRGATSWHSHPLALCPLASPFTSLVLSLLIYKMG